MRYKKFNPDEMLLPDLLAYDRTLLSIERTILAYLRTAIAFFAGGVTMIAIFSDHSGAFVAGIALLIIGLGVVALAILRLVQLRKKLGHLHLK